MSEEENARTPRRYVALDIHKYYCVVAGVNRDGQVVLQPVRVDCRIAACGPGRVVEKEPAKDR